MRNLLWQNHRRRRSRHANASATHGLIPIGIQQANAPVMVVGEVLYDFEQQENRKRARTTKDRQWLWQVGHALLADLAYHYLNGSPGNGLVVRRAKSELGKQETAVTIRRFSREAFRSFSMT